MLNDDTIVAVATAPGAAALAVIRVSGTTAHAIMAAVFRPRRAGRLRPMRLRYGWIVDAHGTVVDEAMVVVMRAPHSYTTEDMAEISCHGGTLVVQRVIGCLLAAGARAAQPGEFTLRAFLNGRIDLTRAEAVMDVVSARSERALALARQQLRGALGDAIGHLRDELLGALAYCTALVDFPEDGVDAVELGEPLRRARAAAQRLLDGAAHAMRIREGARIVLCGRPNAGKSSLLNALLGHDRAIVTPYAGTTRDTIEEHASLDGLAVTLVDTAGIAPTTDPIETLGIERSHQAIAGADLIVALVDANGTPAALHEALAHDPARTLLVLTKCDRWPETPPLVALAREHATACAGILAVSIHQPASLAACATTIAALVLGAPTDDAGAALTRPRHRDALRRAAAALDVALTGVAEQRSPDLLALDVHDALLALDEITGERVDDELLDAIFSRFCIGK
jgi:tRNA modification GTPase